MLVQVRKGKIKMKVWSDSVIVTKTKIAGKDIWFASSDPEDTIQKRHINTGNFYEQEELLIIKRNMISKANILDIGSNIGNHAIFFEKFCEANRVYLIEPNPTAVRLLSLNVALNNLTTVETEYLGVGLSDEFTSLSVVQPEHNLGGAKLQSSGGKDFVDVMPGDFEFSKKKIDFIKIDVEGMEMAVLDGLAMTINKNNPDIFIEVDNVNMDLFMGWINTNNYEVIEKYKRYKSNENFYIRRLS